MTYPTGPVRPLDGPDRPPNTFPVVAEPLTPAMLGIGDDTVAQALYALSRFGDHHTPREARILLSSWARVGELTPEQIGEVLDYYRPAEVATLPPHCGGLLPLMDRALRGVA